MSALREQTTKEQVLSFLCERDGGLSGEEMARRLGLSRMAVCKAVQSLREDGYDIRTKKSEGYTLLGAQSVLCAPCIRAQLEQEHPVTVFDSVDSTNSYLRAHTDLAAGTVVAARSQSAGRGRQGKGFYSPAGSGVYFSLLIKKEIPLEDMWAVTFMAALATAQTLRAFGAPAQIKWVNDIFLPPKKVCGILTEVTLDAESRVSRNLVVGIGINLKTCPLPPELSPIVGALDQVGLYPGANETVAQVINRFDRLFADYDIPALVSAYKKLCFILGKRVFFVKDGRERTGIAADILNNGNLLVQTDEGELILSSGEISIRTGE